MGWIKVRKGGKIVRVRSSGTKQTREIHKKFKPAKGKRVVEKPKVEPKVEPKVDPERAAKIAANESTVKRLKQEAIDKGALKPEEITPDATELKVDDKKGLFSPGKRAALVTGIGLVSGGAAVKVGGSLAKAGLSFVSSRGLNTVKVGKVAAGGLTKFTFRERATIINTVVAKHVTSYLSKLVSTVKHPAITLGILSAYAFTTQMAANERGDAVMGLQIAITQSLKEDDEKGATEMKEALDEIANPTFWERFAPITPYFLAVRDKVEAAKLVTDKAFERYAQVAEKEAAEEQKWADIEEKKKKAVEEKRADDEAYFAQIEENRKLAKAEEREEDEIYWAGIAEKNKKIKEDERKADEEYWASIREKNK